MTIRIVSIISRMNVGGPALMLKKLVDNLPEDFEHTLITGVCGPNELDFLASSTIRGDVITLPGMRRSVSIFRDLVAVINTAKIIHSIKPDIVHTHTSKAGVVGRIVTKVVSPKTKIVHTFHGHLLYGYFGKARTRLVILIEKSLALISDALIAVSNNVQNDLRTAGIGRRSNWKVIHVGLKSKNELIPRSEMNVGQQNFIEICWIGRFTAIKNPMLAIDATRELLSKNRDFHLTMIGDGELWEECKNYANHHSLPITFEGWQSQIDDYLQNADLLLITSKNEGLPLVVIEAAYHSVPTLSTDVGGLSDFITPGRNGLFFDQSVTSLKQKLIDILQNQGELTKLGSAAFVDGRRNFTLESYVQNHVSLYKNIINPSIKLDY